MKNYRSNFPWTGDSRYEWNAAGERGKASLATRLKAYFPEIVSEG